MALTSLSSLCRPLALLLLALATAEATQLQAQAEEVTFSGIYNFFTNELIIRRFYVIIIFQFLFLTAGWFVAHEMWRLVRPDTPTDTDLAGLQDFLLSDENGLIGAAIGMGYGLTGTLLWIGLSQLGNPASASRRSEEAAAHWLVLAKEKETEAKQEVSLLDDVLPSQLSRNAVVQQTLINAVLAGTFLSFWGIMDLLA